MVLKENVLQAINFPKYRLKIALAMGLTENSIRQYIIRNDEKLTQYAPLQVIKEIMGVKIDIELLTETEVA